MAPRAAVLLIAVLVGVRVIGALHAAEYGDPYHTHHGEPCVIKVLLESAPADVSLGPCVVRQFSTRVADYSIARIAVSRVARTAHTIRAPPQLST